MRTTRTAPIILAAFLLAAICTLSGCSDTLMSAAPATPKPQEVERPDQWNLWSHVFQPLQIDKP